MALNNAKKKSADHRKLIICNRNHGFYDWRITGSTLQKILNAKIGDRFDSEHFHVCNLSFKLVLRIKSVAVSNTAEANLVCYLSITSWPEQIESITLRRSLQCQQASIVNTHIFQYTAVNKSRGWADGRLLQSELQKVVAIGAAHTQCLNFVADVNILQILHRTHSLLLFLPVHPSSSKQQKPKQKHSKPQLQQIVWNIGASQLSEWRNARLMNIYQSDIINDAWLMHCCPHGWDEHNHDSVQIGLCFVGALAAGTPAYDVKFEIQCPEMQRQIQERLVFDYRDSFVWYSFVDSAALKQHTQLTLIANIEIMEDADADEDVKLQNGDGSTLGSVAQDILDLRFISMSGDGQEMMNQLQRDNAMLNKKLSELENRLNDIDATPHMKQSTVLLHLDEKQTADLQNGVNGHVYADSKSMSNVSRSSKASKTERLRAWLKHVLELEEYFDTFVENGFDDLETVKLMTMNELVMINIHKVGHRMRILNAVKLLSKESQI